MTLGTLGQQGLETALTAHGVDPGWAALSGDIAGLGIGARLGRIPEASYPGLAKNFLRSEQGEIIIGPGPEWSSTLLDLIKQKAPAKASKQLYLDIMAGAPKEEAPVHQPPRVSAADGRDQGRAAITEART